MPDTTIEVINERLSNFFRENKEDHTEIIKQTSKTNGDVQSLKKWRYTMTGGLIVLNTFIVPVVLWMFYRLLSA